MLVSHSCLFIHDWHNRTMQLLVHVAAYSIHMFKKGPQMVPWGTPHIIKRNKFHLVYWLFLIYKNTLSFIFVWKAVYKDWLIDWFIESKIFSECFGLLLSCKMGPPPQKIEHLKSFPPGFFQDWISSDNFPSPSWIKPSP